MEEFIETVLQKVEKEVGICRKIVEATIARDETILFQLNEEFKRAADDLEAYLDLKDDIDLEKAMQLVEMSGENMLGRPSFLPFCAKEALHHFKLRSELPEDVYVRSCALKEETIRIQYTLEMEKYIELEGHEKDVMFEFMAMTIFNSPAFLEAFKGNYERAEELFTPENFLPIGQANACIELFLNEYAANHYLALETLIDFKNRDGESDDYTAYQILMDNYELSLLDEEFTIAAIYVTAKQRELDITPQDFNFRFRRTKKLLAEAGNIGEEYLKKRGYQYKRGAKKDTSES